MAETTNAFAMAQQQFDHVADLLGLDHQVREMLRWPMREYHLRVRSEWMMAAFRYSRLPCAAQ